MERLIDANALIKEAYAEGAYGYVNAKQISDAPTVDAVPVRHGSWIEDHDYLKCPECGAMFKLDFTFFDIGDWNFCPNCGTNLDLEE